MKIKKKQFYLVEKRLFVDIHNVFVLTIFCNIFMTKIKKYAWCYLF